MGSFFKRGALLLVAMLLIGILAVIIWPEKYYNRYDVSPAYQAQVDGFRLPEMPGDWLWKVYTAEDDMKLRYGETGNASAARATLIMVPGYTATMDMYAEHVHELGSQGLHVVGIDMRGQGGSERHRPAQPEKLWIDDFSTYSNDLADFVEALKLPEDRLVILMGMSFGGHVVVRTAAEHESVAEGLMLLAPAFAPKADGLSKEQAIRVLAWGRKLGKANQYLPGNDNWKPYSEGDLYISGLEHCSTNSQRLPLRDVVFVRKPEQRVGGITFQWGAEFYESSDVILTDGYFDSVDIPVTVINAEVDTFVKTSVNQQVCANDLPNCKTVNLPNTGHCLLQESDAALEAIYAEIEALIDRASKSISQ